MYEDKIRPYPRSGGAPAFEPFPENVLALRQARDRCGGLYFTNETVPSVQCHRTQSQVPLRVFGMF